MLRFAVTTGKEEVKKVPFCLLSHLPNQISVPLSFVHFLLDVHFFLKICKRGKYSELFFLCPQIFVYVIVEGGPSLVGKSTLL